jgi:hypothetical protein
MCDLCIPEHNFNEQIQLGLRVIPLIADISICFGLPTLKCWRILVSAERLDGFDCVITQLEKLAWQPEQICMGCTDDLPDAGRRHDGDPCFHFKPP